MTGLLDSLPWLTKVPLRRVAVAVAIGSATLGSALRAEAQQIRGRILDSENGRPVAYASVVLLNSVRAPVLAGTANNEGIYRVSVPGLGHYYLLVERIGYLRRVTPPLAVESMRDFHVDIEIRPEAFRLDSLTVTVENEQLEDFLSLRFGQHPATVAGYRAIQGLRLAEAKMKARDNTDLLRWLYVPVSHGRQVCVGTFGAPRAARSYSALSEGWSGASGGGGQCGALYVNDHRCRNEHIETIDMAEITVVVVVRGAVHMYTRDFDWTFRSGGRPPAC